MGWRKRALVLSVRQQYDSKIQNAAPVSPDAWGETGAAFHGRFALQPCIRAVLQPERAPCRHERIAHLATPARAFDLEVHGAAHSFVLQLIDGHTTAKRRRRGEPPCRRWRG